MTVFKCKMCGGALEISEGSTVTKCVYCGTHQTLPHLDDERRANLYDRANHFRRNNDFDKAMAIYEQILTEDGKDAEAYWSLVLCRFGIEYVEDPATKKRIPTVNRAQYTSVFDDDNYKSALAYATEEQRGIYESEAHTISEIQKGIIAISQKEEPFDVFICYKETDEGGRRTRDSVLAQELYYQLKGEGYKVFFSRITLEDKLGSAYEPYIFAALNSAKIMVVVGTRPEFFNAAWVKNEWSRYLALIKNGAQKTLIPAYRDMDPYDLPEEFSHLQAQDMGKLGFMQDLIRGIKKIIKASTPKTPPAKESSIPTASAGIASLLKRLFMFLEDGDFESAAEYAEKVLDIDPECAFGYLGKLMAELNIKTREDLGHCEIPFDDHNSCQKALRFGDDKLKSELQGYLSTIRARNESARLEEAYQSAFTAMDEADSEETYTAAASVFFSLGNYKDAATLGERCLEQAKLEKEERMRQERKAAEERKRYEEAERERKARFKKISLISISCLCIVLVFSIILNHCGNPFQTTPSGGDYTPEESTGSDLLQSNHSTEKSDDNDDPSENYIVAPGAEEIAADAFAGNETLTSIVIPASVEIIGLNAFANCTNLKSIAFEEGSALKRVSAGAFYECTSLAEFKFPVGTITIGDDIFLEEPDAVVADAGGVFAGCTNLTSVTIPNTVVTIGTYAFASTGLTSVAIPDSVTNIGKGAFSYCSNLTDATLSNNLTRIRERTFSGCTGLTSITIPDSVTSIEADAFSDCFALADVYYTGTASEWNAIDIASGNSPLRSATLYCNTESPITAYDTYVSLMAEKKYAEAYNVLKENPDIEDCNEKIEEIQNLVKEETQSHIAKGDYATAYRDLSAVGHTETTVPLLEAYRLAAEGYYISAIEAGLTDFVIAENTEVIGDYYFENCDKLTSITIPDSVTSIGDFAFTGCTSLASIIIPSSVATIGIRAFSGCTGLKSIAFDEDSSLNFIGEEAFTNCAALTSITIPHGVTTLGTVYLSGHEYEYLGMFNGCTKLENITIPNSVTTIGSFAFYNCTSLTSITIPGSITNIGSWAFSDCSALADVYYTGTESEWNAIDISSYNSDLTSATIYFYSATAPTASGNYWRYVNGVPTAW
ncbi:MAG: TIR domain-containing protein [Ruminococcaceae bacterium]|nr:TIR domain-containing protein [Oscillospiraceae bacterium]